MDRIIVDGHCDTISEIFKKDEKLLKNKQHIDLQRMKAAGKYVQFFAAFINAKKITKSPMISTMQIIDRLYSEVERNQEYIKIAYCHEDIMRITDKGKSAAVISIEGGETLEGDLSALRILHRLGVRCIGLTWNHKNEIASGCGEEVDTGLSGFGIEVVKEMNRLKMLVDVSHLGDLGFWHVINYSKAPIIASHSNARKVCAHKRNLSDDQIIALAEKGGLMGMNFYPPFLTKDDVASMKHVIEHIEHIAGLVGTEHIGLGSDFDGIEVTPRGLEDISKVENIFNELAKKNYTQEQIDGIAGGNFLRVIKEVIG